MFSQRTDALPVKPLPKRTAVVDANNLKPAPPTFNGRKVWLVAEHMSQCPTLRDHLTLMYDGIKAHEELARNGVLHRNINPDNILRVVHTYFDADSLQPGPPEKLMDMPGKSHAVLIDCDHAAFFNMKPRPCQPNTEEDHLASMKDSIMKDISQRMSSSSLNHDPDNAAEDGKTPDSDHEP
ncbi:hypothetical protein EXIGLDRAFT_844212 [Exidia glandulosa HHB12029]|uniref:Fungal-type protein kinase domain-containing protein n=1 Tax=Exidia glandulosa HHB12029 TaxID=1314781 RepID=A0A165C6D0_EXIGL|nr:hypothetical protein EXIGLDRAFT_844212 [Exidia glandulosa HHB12029]